MSPQAIGAMLLVMLIVFIFSRIWFHCVEMILSCIKRIFGRKKQPPVWHELPQDKEEES